MAEHGATLWEAFDADSKNLSLNHWTHSAVSEWLWSDVVGLAPDEQHPGYQTFAIYPRPTQEVGWCRADYNSPRGKIVCNWRRAEDKFSLETSIPANTTATVYFPAKDAGSVIESGKPVAQSEGVTLLRTEPGLVVFQIGSGAYHFESLP
jgi:alpha-L-rhamnosidase